MNLRQAIDAVNALTDEGTDDATLLSFINDAIAEVNIRAKANYPFATLDDLGNDFPLPDKWVRALYVQYAAARDKQKESSQYEYSDLYQMFESAVNDFIATYYIPDEYRDKSDQYTDPETGETRSYFESDIFDVPTFPWHTRW